MSYRKRGFRENPLVVDQAELHRQILGFRGPHARAATLPPGAGLRPLPIPREPVNEAAPASAMGALARRTGLFVVAYAPLAAIFVAAKWPTGRSMPDLLLLALWLAALAGFLALPLASSFVRAGRPRRAVARASILAAAVAALGAILGWHEPMSVQGAAPGSSAAAAGVAFGFCVAAGVLVALMLLTARRPSTASWQVRHPGEPGGAVADYLWSYLLPIWILWIANVDDGWGGPALAIYLFIVYVVFVRSRRLVLVSPLLNLLGFRLYNVRLQGSGGAPRPVVLIARKALAPETRVTALALGEDCYVGRRA